MIWLSVAMFNMTFYIEKVSQIKSFIFDDVEVILNHLMTLDCWILIQGPQKRATTLDPSKQKQDQQWQLDPNPMATKQWMKTVGSKSSDQRKKMRQLASSPSGTDRDR